MNLYPIMINLEGKQVLIIGGGRVALRKARGLLESGAVVKIVSPEFHIDFKSLKEEYQNRLTLVEKKYTKGDLKNSTLVFSAVNNAEINNCIHRDAAEKNIWINAVDDPQNCSFYVPSFSKHGDLILALSTSGTSPAMAARLRRQLEKELPDDIDRILKALGSARDILKRNVRFQGIGSGERGKILNTIVNDEIILKRLCSSLESNDMEQFLAEYIK